MDRVLLQDSEGVNESFWDGLGVEFEAKYILDFRVRPVGGPWSERRGPSGTGGHGAAPGRGDTGPPPWGRLQLLYHDPKRVGCQPTQNGSGNRFPDPWGVGWAGGVGFGAHPP